MDRCEFLIYMGEFERRILIEGWRRGFWGVWDSVTVRPGRLARQDIGRFLGTRFTSDHILAIDYYGLTKKSTRFMSMAADLGTHSFKTINAPVIHFASVKLEHILELAPDLVPKFAEFKESIKFVRFGSSVVTTTA